MDRKVGMYAYRFIKTNKYLKEKDTVLWLEVCNIYLRVCNKRHGQGLNGSYVLCFSLRGL